MQKDINSVMIVSKNSKMVEFIRSAMPPDKFSPVIVVADAGQARRTILRTPAEIVIIDTPLPDEFGTRLALDLSEKCALAVIVKPELLERTSYKLEQHGIVTLPRTLYRSLLYQTLMLLSVSVTKMKQLSKDRDALKAKLREVRIVTKAKTLLISEKSMTEEEAHHYIEKAAMDSGKKKTDVAAELIRELSDDIV